MKDLIKSYVTPASAGLALFIAALMAAFWLTASSTEHQIEQAVRRDFTAAGFLSRLQVEGEKMRRFEKEAFIHINDAGQRQKYFKEFDHSYSVLLSLLDSMLAPSGTSFTDADRVDMAQWKVAALVYGSQFTALIHQAELGDTDKLSAEQRAVRTLDFNARITEGKNRFRVLLGGTERLRQLKETGAQTIADDIARLLMYLRISIGISGIVLIGLLLYLLRPATPSRRGPDERRLDTALSARPVSLG